MILPVMEVCFITKKNFIKKTLLKQQGFFYSYGNTGM